MFLEMTVMSTDPRSEEDADKSNRVFNKLHAVIYVWSLVFVIRSTGLTRRSATYFHRGEEGRNEEG
jgi:hypothetical protein